MKKNIKPKKLRGFTLVELTVSMGILALIVGLTAGVLISVVKAYQKQKVISAIERNGDFVMRTFEESLRGAQEVSCTDSNGNAVSASPCNLLSGQMLRVSYSGTSQRYLGVGSGEIGRTCDGTVNCSVYSISNISTDIDAGGNLSNEDFKMTNDSDDGVHISDFSANIQGGSGQPYSVTVTMSVRGPLGSALHDETRTFQSFLTLRGTYK